MMKSSILNLLFPATVIVLLKRLGLVFLLLSVTRLMFFLVNRVYLQEASVLDFILGLRFDASVSGYLFSVFAVLSLLAGILYRYKAYRIGLAFFYFFPLAVALLMNLSDAVYFRFIFRRSTFDAIRYFSSASADGWRLLPIFIVEFWYIPVLFILLMAYAAWAYKRSVRSYQNSTEGWTYRTIGILIIAGLSLLAGRGGLQVMPINLVDAGLRTHPSNMPLVLNTTFSVMVTAMNQKEESVSYFTPEEAGTYFSLEYNVKPHTRSFKGKNVVILILESFGQEYTGYYNKTSSGYTPFLDSLLNESYVFVNAFANAKQSVDAVPAILSGIPALTAKPFIESVYAGNRMPSLATYFNQQGYRTQFFHGGANGTMGFEAFAKSADIQKYYGKNQYPMAERDYDGNWGIYDEPYLKYFANELTKNNQPFFSVLFTLSSHHPYSIPKQYQGKFPKGSYEIHESIGYADYSLKQFFIEAEKQPWYDNTLFVITGDHTSHSEKRFYQLGHGMGIYTVPIAFYDPGTHWKGVDSTLIQHVDLFPTLISLTGGDVKGKFFGRNAFDSSARHEVLNHIYGGMFNYLIDTTQVAFSEHRAVGVYRYPKDSSLKVNLLLRHPTIVKKEEAVIKAKIQVYFQNMEANTWMENQKTKPERKEKSCFFK